ncbi:MAG: peptidase domain-containing ABC transporter, partial [Merismopedia sp. SIO2A8]|nr:peptidase domain-containing ABC transporter [Merismopedia sp. SIO2A8]
FSIWGIVMSAVRQYLLSYVSNRFDLTLISGFIRHTIALPLKFFESRRVGDIITRVQENQKIQKFLVDRVVLAWLDVVTGVVYLGLMAYYNWQLTILVLCLIPPIVILALGATPFLRRITRDIFKQAADQNSSLVELISGVEAIKSAAVERDVRWRWEEKLTRQLNAQFRGAKLGIGLESANGLVQVVGSTALLWFGASLVIQDQLTIGQFVAFNMMMGYVISPIVSLANLWDELQEVTVAVERLNDVFEATPEESPLAPMLMLPPLTGHVILENITFRYDQEGDRNTLQNIALDIPSGTTLAIVGRSGSGKTTLIKLLQGLYHPNSGRVLMDSHDIRHVSPPSLRQQIGVVPQDCFLFSGTILENITLYRPNCSLEEVVEAAKLAEAHAFIQALPLGYNTKVGERGSTLSGGQRQRIAIARALVGKPPILILDEATSSLDTESERRFQRNLKQLSRNRTTFIIAHRLSTVREADQIVVLDRGIIAELGTHVELMNRKGLYYHLAQQQLNL